jgi:hypothetical protein
MSVEHFIKANRHAFDEEKPSEQVWANIVKQVDTKSASPGSFSFLRGGKLAKFAAAIGLILFGIGLGVHFSRIGDADKQVFAMSQIGGAEFEETASYYQRDISAKTQKLAQFSSQKDAVEPDLIYLERVMEDLKKELENVPPARRQEVISAMIENYKTRASLLERVLSHLEQQNHKSQNNESKNI